MLRIIPGACAALVGLGLLAGCNPRDAENLTQDTRQAVEHTGQALGSAKVAASVNAVLALCKGVDMSGLHVEAQDGVVTISGHVRSEEEKKIISETVPHIRGVDKFINKLRIQPR